MPTPTISEAFQFQVLRAMEAKDFESSEVLHQAQALGLITSRSTCQHYWTKEGRAAISEEVKKKFEEDVAQKRAKELARKRAAQAAAEAERIQRLEKLYQNLLAEHEALSAALGRAQARVKEKGGAPMSRGSGRVNGQLRSREWSIPKC